MFAVMIRSAHGWQLTDDEHGTRWRRVFLAHTWSQHENERAALIEARRLRGDPYDPRSRNKDVHSVFVAPWDSRFDDRRFAQRVLG